MFQNSFIKSYGALIVCIGHLEQENEIIPIELWNAFFLLSQRLHRIKHPYVNQTCNVLDQDLKSRFETLSLSTMDQEALEIQVYSPCIHDLPTEILSLVFEYLQESQMDLYQSALTCKRWYLLANPLIYKSPQLYDITAIQRVLTLSRTSSYFGWNYKGMVQSIHFGPCRSGSLLGSECIPGLDHIFQSHSCLYRLIVQDRDLYPGFHPIFLNLVKAFPNVKQIKEIRHTLSSSSPINTYLRRSPRPGLNMSDYILTRLLKSAKTTFEMKEWSHIEVHLIQPICIFLLDLFQNENHLLSQLIPNGIRNCKHSVVTKVRNALNILSSALLLQVQYVTICSQRLLDAYCMIYYEALDLSNWLNVDRLKILIETTDSEPRIREQVDCIYDCLTLLFHEYSSPSTDNTDSTDEESLVPKKRILDFDKVKNVITTFPPSGINKETCEFIEHTLENHVMDWSMDLEMNESNDLHYWRQWLQSILVWHKASKQMEPVKDLLRSNMSKIDMLRGVQVRYIYINLRMNRDDMELYLWIKY